MSMAMKSNQPAAVMNGSCPVDLILAGVASFLIVYGLVMVGSASLEVGAKTYGNAFHLFNRHVMYLGVSLVAAALVGRGEWTVREASTDRHHSPATETTTGVVTQWGRLLETLATGASNSEKAVLTAEIREAQASSKVVTQVVGRASAVMRLATGAVERILSHETRICRKAVHMVALTATVTGVATAWGRPPGRKGMVLALRIILKAITTGASTLSGRLRARLKMMPVLLDSAAQQPIGVVVPSPSARP